MDMHLPQRTRACTAGLLVVSVCVAPLPARAENNPKRADTRQSQIEEIVVTAHPLSGEGLSQPADLLSGDELERKKAATIGETLANQPGIHSAQFGAAVSRPVIHGLGGPRVRVMEDRIDALDVSVTSADHAVSIEPFIADRVEVLKGSSALLYGSGAIGGVVDVHTGRIPHIVPERLDGGLEYRHDGNSDRDVVSGKVNGGRGAFAWHADATFKDGNDYDIPGFSESARLRALEAAEEEDPDEDHDDGPAGSVPGTAFESDAFAVGSSFVADWGFVGAAVSHLDAQYGLPGAHGHEEEDHEEESEAESHGADEEGTPTLEMQQTRLDVELGIDAPFGSVSRANVRFGLNDYEHEEIEEDGAVASRLTNDAWELRGELVYETDHWTGALGAQHTDRDFAAIGEEAFLPGVRSRESGVFWVASRNYGRVELETGVRGGRARHRTDTDSRSFTTYAASLGANWTLSDLWTLSLIADVASRAPVAEELFSNGAHLVTNAFELGDPDLDSERARSLSATLNGRGVRWMLNATAYVTEFSDFIYQQDAGFDIEDLPVSRFQQAGATFYGLDSEVALTLREWATGTFTLHGLLDFVETRLDVSGAELPRIPPLRYGVGAEFQDRLGGVGDRGVLVTLTLDYLRNARQRDVAPRELPTGGYDDLRAYAGVEIPMDNRSIVLFVAGHNLTDDEQRRHTSFIKDTTPSPGRTVEAGVQLRF